MEPREGIFQATLTCEKFNENIMVQCYVCFQESINCIRFHLREHKFHQVSPLNNLKAHFMFKEKLGKNWAKIS